MPHAQPLHQHGDRQHESRGIGDTLADQVGRRAVARIRDRVLVAHVKRRSQTEPSGERTRLVGKYIAEHVRNEEHVVALRPRVEVGGHRIDVNLAKCDVLVLFRLRIGFTHEETVSYLQHVLLANGAYVLAAACRVVESHFGDAARARARDLAHRQCDIFCRHEVRNAHKHVAVGIETFGVFTRDQHVEPGPCIGHPRARTRRPQVCIELEPFADRAGHVDAALFTRRIKRHAAWAENDPVGRQCFLDRGFRHGIAAFPEACHADINDFKLQAKRVSAVNRFEQGHRDFGDFGPDVVAGHDYDMHCSAFHELGAGGAAAAVIICFSRLRRETAPPILHSPTSSASRDRRESRRSHRRRTGPAARARPAFSVCASPPH